MSWVQAFLSMRSKESPTSFPEPRSSYKCSGEGKLDCCTLQTPMMREKLPGPGLAHGSLRPIPR